MPMKRFHLVLLAGAVMAAGPAWAKGPPGGVPPGLAKKPGQMPPGQAKKIYQKGERLPLTYMRSRYYVSEPVRYHLEPAPPGYRWVLVEDNAYLANTQTGLIASVILNLLSR
jgi:hypothetical protein